MYADFNYSLVIDFVDQDLFEPCLVKIKLTHADNKRLKFTFRKTILEIDNTIVPIEFTVYK
jgi:hypothetical protein